MEIPQYDAWKLRCKEDEESPSYICKECGDIQNREDAQDENGELCNGCLEEIKNAESEEGESDVQ